MVNIRRRGALDSNQTNNERELSASVTNKTTLLLWYHNRSATYPGNTPKVIKFWFSWQCCLARCKETLSKQDSITSFSALLKRSQIEKEFLVFQSKSWTFIRMLRCFFKKKFPGPLRCFLSKQCLSYLHDKHVIYPFCMLVIKRNLLAFLHYKSWRFVGIIWILCLCNDIIMLDFKTVKNLRKAV